jgi:hypothetical protein
VSVRLTIRSDERNDFVEGISLMRPTRIEFVAWFSAIVLLFYVVMLSLLFRKVMTTFFLVSGIRAAPPPTDNTLLYAAIGFALTSAVAMRLYCLHLRKRRSWVGYCSTCGANLHGDRRCMTCGQRQSHDLPRPRGFEVIRNRKSDSVLLHA